MNIDDRHLIIIKSILSKYPYTFYIFGSRAKKTNKKFSDLDICYLDEIPSRIVIELENDFEESDIPYKVDIVAFNTCAEEFKKNISRSMICIQG